MHLQTGIEYVVKEADDKSGRFVLEMLSIIARRDKSSRDEIVLSGWLKIPKLNEEIENEERAKATVEAAMKDAAKGIRVLDRVKSAVGL